MLRSHAFSKELLTRPFSVHGIVNSLLSSNLPPQKPITHQQPAAPSTEHRLQCFRRPYHMVSRCQAFVGERTESAQEYHSADFDFHEHKAAVDEQLANDPSAYQIPEGSGKFMLPLPGSRIQETCSTLRPSSRSVHIIDLIIICRPQKAAHPLRARGMGSISCTRQCDRTLL